MSSRKAWTTQRIPEQPRLKKEGIRTTDWKLTLGCLLAVWSLSCLRFCQRSPYCLWRPNALGHSFAGQCVLKSQNSGHHSLASVHSAYRHLPCAVWIHSNLYLSDYKSENGNENKIQDAEQKLGKVRTFPKNGSFPEQLTCQNPSRPGWLNWKQLLEKSTVQSPLTQTES